MKHQMCLVIGGAFFAWSLDGALLAAGNTPSAWTTSWWNAALGFVLCIGFLVAGTRRGA